MAIVTKNVNPVVVPSFFFEVSTCPSRTKFHKVGIYGSINRGYAHQPLCFAYDSGSDAIYVICHGRSTTVLQEAFCSKTKAYPLTPVL